MTDQKTILITGIPRGGTTCLARVVNTLGMNMYYTSNKSGTLEHVYFREKINSNRIDSIIADIKALNSTYDIWSYKHPLLFGWLKDNHHLFRNPYVIYVHRDPIAIYDSIKRHHGEADQECIKLIYEELTRTVHILPTLGVPYYFISYEKILTKPEEEIKKLVSFLDIDFVPEAVEEVILNDPRYIESLIDG